MTDQPIGRRDVLKGATAFGVGAVTMADVAGCASDPEPTASTTSNSDPQALVAVDDIPVGGAVIVDGAGVVVTQPEPGTVAAFSSTCTHRGCPVSDVADGVIVCRCHGSQFSVIDGSVVRGPAEVPLPPEPIDVRDGSVFLA